MNAPARDTRTLGQRCSDARDWASTPDRRHNRELRPVLRINWRAAGWYVFALGVSIWLASPEARPLWIAIWSAS